MIKQITAMNDSCEWVMNSFSGQSLEIECGDVMLTTQQSTLRQRKPGFSIDSQDYKIVKYARSS
jgi:hypothetical protein